MRTYGFWAIGVTAGLSVLCDLGLEPYARANHLWFWEPTKLPFDWCGAPISNFVGWPAVVVLMMAFATPALINKQGTKSPPNYQPLLTWNLINVLFITSAITQHLWAAVAVSSAAVIATSIFAIRGARW